LVMKKKWEFQLDLTKWLFKTVYLARAQHVVTQLQHFKQYGRHTFKGITRKEQHPAIPSESCTSHRKISDITCECENVWTASMFSWVLWKLSHLQNH
jgi:hypothetical protein